MQGGLSVSTSQCNRSPRYCSTLSLSLTYKRLHPRRPRRCKFEARGKKVAFREVALACCRTLYILTCAWKALGCVSIECAKYDASRACSSQQQVQPSFLFPPGQTPKTGWVGKRRRRGWGESLSSEEASLLHWARGLLTAANWPTHQP